MEVQLGDYVTDRLTGFKGTVSGIVKYLSGCVQALVVPVVGADGKMPESTWFDLQRLEVDPSQPRIVLENSAAPGCDAPAPHR